MVRTTLLFIVMGIYLALAGKFINLYFADVYYAASKKELDSGQLEDAADHIVQAIKLNRHEPAYRRQKVKILLATLIWADENEVKEEVLKNLEKAYDLNPKNLATLRNSIPLYYFLAAEDMEKAGTGENIDTDYLSVTRTYYSALKNNYENDLGLYADIAKYEKKLGLVEDFNRTKIRAAVMRKNIIEWHESFR
jgi:tetratricopeptide (TPR) repeat protein